MSEPLVLAIDQGTHASRALVFDPASGAVVAQATEPVALERGPQGQVTQHPQQLLESTQQAMAQCLAQLPPDRHPCAAGLATQRSTLVAWQRDQGQALYAALNWQDTRSRAWVHQQAARREWIYQHSGLPFSPHYSAAKAVWLLQQVPAVAAAAAADQLCLAPLAAYLLHHLLAEAPCVLDAGNAARTQLYDPRQGHWSPPLLQEFHLQRRWLPEIRPVRHPYGRLRACPIPLRAVNGDQNSASFGLGPPRPDQWRINLGSGAFILAPQQAPPPGFLYTLLDSDAGQRSYACEATVNGCATALDWVMGPFAGTWQAQNLDACYDQVSQPPLFINGVGGLGSPWWQVDIAPHFLQPAETAAAALAGALESIAFLLQANLERLQQHLTPPRQLLLSGGLSHSRALTQMIADLSGLPCLIDPEPEATAKGIAYLAAPELKWHWPTPTEIRQPRPNPPLKQRYQSLNAYLEQYDG